MRLEVGYKFHNFNLPKGPVIGPLVMCGVTIEEKDISRLKSLGVKDSKLLTRKERDGLFDNIKKIIKDHKIIIISPKEIDNALESDDLNLNWLEAHKAAEIINKLKPDRTIVDSPSNNCMAYSNYLKKLLKNKIELICIHKAERFPVVAAASILAKVTRDKEMEKIQEKYGNCGPGYPSNELTQKFLKENWEKHPEIFRQTWSSYQNHKNMKHQKKLGDFHKFIKDEQPVFKDITKEDLKELEKYGYKAIKTKSQYEIARLKGPATITLYKTGKLLIQGKDMNKEIIKKLLQSKGFEVK